LVLESALSRIVVVLELLPSPSGRRWRAKSAG
jgi:hypothetical protein